MTPISQRTILFSKATYAIAKKRRNAAALSGKIFNLKFFFQIQCANYNNPIYSAFMEAKYNVYLESNHQVTNYHQVPNNHQVTS